MRTLVILNVIVLCCFDSYPMYRVDQLDQEVLLAHLRNTHNEAHKLLETSRYFKGSEGTFHPKGKIIESSAIMHLQEAAYPLCALGGLINKEGNPIVYPPALYELAFYYCEIGNIGLSLSCFQALSNVYHGKSGDKSRYNNVRKQIDTLEKLLQLRSQNSHASRD